jgi:hypothetical protein
MFDATADVMIAMEPATGLTVKGLGKVMRYLSRKADEADARQRRS